MSKSDFERLTGYNMYNNNHQYGGIETRESFSECKKQKTVNKLFFDKKNQ